MLGAQSWAAVVVEEHVGREGPLEVVALGVLEALLLLLELLEFLGSLGLDVVGFSGGLTRLLLVRGLLLVFGAIIVGRERVYWGKYQLGHRVLLGEGGSSLCAADRFRAIFLGQPLVTRSSPRAAAWLGWARRCIEALTTGLLEVLLQHLEGSLHETAGFNQLRVLFLLVR